VQQAREAAEALGPVSKAPLDIEEDVAAVSRQSLCATHDLPAGHRITQADLTIKRPGTGIPAKALDQVIGQVTCQAVASDQLLQWTDLA
jgi:sialic acid synthase SpsE